MTGNDIINDISLCLVIEERKAILVAGAVPNDFRCTDLSVITGGGGNRADQSVLNTLEGVGISEARAPDVVGVKAGVALGDNARL